MGTSIRFPVLHTNKQVHETAFSRDENSIITVIVCGNDHSAVPGLGSFCSGELSVGRVLDCNGPILTVGPSQRAHIFCGCAFQCFNPTTNPIALHPSSLGRICWLIKRRRRDHEGNPPKKLQKYMKHIHFD